MRPPEALSRQFATGKAIRAWPNPSHDAHPDRTLAQERLSPAGRSLSRASDGKSCHLTIDLRFPDSAPVAGRNLTDGDGSGLKLLTNTGP